MQRDERIKELSKIGKQRLAQLVRVGVQNQETEAVRRWVGGIPPERWSRDELIAWLLDAEGY